jgi:hypothetical protein
MHRRSALLALTAIVYVTTLATVLARGASVATVIFGTVLFAAIALAVKKLL